MQETKEWICVLEDSSQLKPLQIMELELEKEIVLWRSESGKICAMEARCPHQWSHLKYEGMVDGEEIVCVTHFWTFEQNGCGWKDSDLGRRDKKGDIVTFPCKEENGAIFVQLDNS